MDNINNINDLFKGTNHVVLFVALSDAFSGHWQLLLRTDKAILFFDSYGKPFSYILKIANGKFGQTDKLAQIIINSNIKTEINTVKYQNTDPRISTCGYHVLTCFSVFSELENDFDFDVYKQFMDTYMKRYNIKSYDEAVIKIVLV